MCSVLLMPLSIGLERAVAHIKAYYLIRFNMAYPLRYGILSCRYWTTVLKSRNPCKYLTTNTYILTMGIPPITTV